jgi:hypothetical protein
MPSEAMTMKEKLWKTYNQCEPKIQTKCRIYIRCMFEQFSGQRSDGANISAFIFVN